MDRRRIRNLSLGALTGVVFVALIGAGGFPSRPRFQLLTVNGSPGTVGTIRTQGIAAGAGNLAYIAFIDSAGTRTGYVGDGSGADSAITLAAETAAANLTLTSGGGGQILLNGVAASDFARLSQPNAFTSSGGGTAAALNLSSATPVVRFSETDAAANNGVWYLAVASAEQLRMSAVNDAFSAEGVFLSVDRTGTTIDTLNLGATAVQTNGVDATAASGTYIATVVGCTTSPTVTAVYRKMGNIVTLVVPPLTCTSNATSLSFSGAPALITPTTGAASTVQTAYGAINNGVTEYGLIACNMATTGAVVCARNSSQTGFTASGSKGFGNALQLTYGLL